MTLPRDESSATFNPPVRIGWVPIWLHLSLAIGLGIGCAAAGFVAAGWVLHSRGISGQSFSGMVIVSALTFSGLLAPMFVLFKLVPARCGKCGGRCWGRTTPSPGHPALRNYDTFKYYCENCNRIVDTTMGGGDG